MDEWKIAVPSNFVCAQVSESLSLVRFLLYAVDDARPPLAVVPRSILPAETNIEVITEQHQAGGLGLCLPFLREHREI